MNVQRLTFGSDTLDNGVAFLSSSQVYMSGLRVASLAIPMSWSQVNPRFKNDRLVIWLSDTNVTANIKLSEGSYNTEQLLIELAKQFASQLPTFKASVSPTTGKLTISNTTNTPFKVIVQDGSCTQLGFTKTSDQPAVTQTGDTVLNLSGSAVHLVSRQLAGKLGHSLYSSFARGVTSRLLSIPINVTFGQTITYSGDSNEFLGISSGSGISNTIELLQMIDLQLEDDHGHILYGTNVDEIKLPWWVSFVIYKNSNPDAQYM